MALSTSTGEKNNVMQHESTKSDSPQEAHGGPPRRMSGMRVVVLVLGVAVLVLAGWRVGFFAPAIPAPTATPLPQIKPVPAFSLTERSGAAVTRETLLGEVWVADFIFTDCPGPCPKLSQRMLRLQRALEAAGLGGKLVSFSLDPERDRPHVLQRYADRFKADTHRWWFLTGDDQEAMWKLVNEGFLNAVFEGDEAHRVEHGTYFIVVGKNGFIRSVQQGLDPDRSVDQLIADIMRVVATLEAESVGPA